MQRTSKFVSRLFALAAVTALAACSNALPALAGGGPENVFLLVNSASADSMEVANHYIRLRKIPSNNVFYLAWRRNLAITQGGKFWKDILLPALEEIDRRQLDGQIDYLVYSCDFPYRIDFADMFPHAGPPKLAPKASLTGATYLYAFVKQKYKEMFALNTNFYSTRPGVGVTVSRGFRARYRWAPGGRRAGENGLPYMLSSMLGVTFGRGNTTDEIVRYLTTSAEADHTQPKGTVYLVKNGGVRSKPRHDLFPAAAKELGMVGMRAMLLQGKFPEGRKDIIGVTCGTAFIDFNNSRNRFLPGAFCDNLTSQGAQFFLQKKQTCLSDFLRLGAAGACGTVAEPGAVREKFPLPTLHVHYARGCSLAESFYQSVSGPYQQLLVGDPLCQPGAEKLEVEVVGVADGDTIRGEVEISPTAKSARPRPIGSFDLFVDGKRHQRCAVGEKFRLATMKLADGHHELRVVATDSTPIEGQGRWLGNVTVKNRRDAVQLSVDNRGVGGDSKRLQIEVASTTDDQFVVKHNGRELGSVAQGAGSVQIDLAKLGKGPVTLFAEASGEAALRSPPLEIVID